MNYLNLNYEENYNVRSAQYLYSLPLSELTELCYQVRESKTKNKIYLKGIQFLLKEIIKKQGIIKRKYKYSKNSINCQGRLYSNGVGLQTLKGNIKGCLLEDYQNVDYDICNAHPNLILYLTKQNAIGIDFPCLTKYASIEGRSEILKSENVSKLDVIFDIFYKDKLKPEYTNSPFLLTLSHELDVIKTYFYNRHLAALALATNKTTINIPKSYNKKSSVLSMIVQTLENEILQQVIKVISDKYKGREGSISALTFDGFIFNKGGREDIPNVKLLNEITNEYGIKWAKKEFDKSIKIPEDFELCTYSALKTAFEKEYCLLMNPQMFVRENIKNDTFSFITRSELEILAAPLFVEDIFDLKTWMADPTRRSYEYMDFIPYVNEDKYNMEKDPDIYNTFRPFTAEYIEDKTQRDDVQPFHHHLLTNVCNENKESYDWLLRVVAYKLQFPNKRPDVGLILKGKQGAGKDMFINFIEEMMGLKNDYCHRTADPTEIFGTFNLAVKNKLIVQLNEMEGKDGMQYKEKLKNIITAEVHTINEKRVKQYKLLNYVFLIICSNNPTPILISPDDRRWVLMHTGEKHIGDRPYFQKLLHHLKTPSFINSLFSELVDMNLAGFSPDNLSLQPKTEEYYDSKIDNIAPIYQYIRDLDITKLREIEKGMYKNKFAICINSFRTNFDIWLDEQNYPSKTGKTTLYKQLRVLKIIAGEQLTVNNKKTSYHIFDKEVVKEILDKMFYKKGEIIDDEKITVFKKKLEIDSDDELDQVF